jgi:hypothetical protein
MDAEKILELSARILWLRRERDLLYKATELKEITIEMSSMGGMHTMAVKPTCFIYPMIRKFMVDHYAGERLHWGYELEQEIKKLEDELSEQVTGQKAPNIFCKYIWACSHCSYNKPDEGECQKPGEGRDMKCPKCQHLLIYTPVGVKGVPEKPKSLTNVEALEAHNKGEHVYRVDNGKVLGIGYLYAYKDGWKTGEAPACECGLCK